MRIKQKDIAVVTIEKVIRVFCVAVSYEMIYY